MSEKGRLAPRPGRVQTGCLVWPVSNNWNNIHARRWMEGGLESVHLKKKLRTFLHERLLALRCLICSVGSRAVYAHKRF